jgi:RNA polymerase sigma-70 factor (ECF subfamily)
MEPENANEHLSEIPTMWTALLQVQQQGTADAASAAQQLMQRYGRPIYRYLLACVRQLDVADELFQEFALRFLRGDFKNADPGRGRFRNYLKTALHHLVADHQRKRKRDSHQALPPAEAGPASTPAADPEGDLLTEWRNELMQHAWDALADWEWRKKQPLHTVLRFRAENPDLRAAEFAERLGARMGTTVTAEWVYKKLHLAREKFAELLLEEVVQTLAEPDTEDLEEELLDLGLLEYCRAALKRRGEP